MRTPERPVMDGARVRWTLEQAAQRDQQTCRIDWLRFTVPLAHVLAVDESLPFDAEGIALLEPAQREQVMNARGVERETALLGAMAVCRVTAEYICSMLMRSALDAGPDYGFAPGACDDKGMDYYSARCPITFAGKTVGFVLAGGKSTAQSRTVHVNLMGEACLHVSHAQWVELARWIDTGSNEPGRITRVDLAVDAFDGHEMASVVNAYHGGEFRVRGKQPGQENAGAWELGHSRTFYVGSRDTGKLFRAYEKGDQLFGHEANSAWIRYEVELRSNHRVITADVLRRPADFFAGAYPFCEAVLHRVGEAHQVQRISTVRTLGDATTEAAVTRVCKWVRDTAGPALARVFFDAGDGLMLHLLEQNKYRMPARLRGIKTWELSRAFDQVAAAFAPPSAPLRFGAA